ncbi:hypothetical protein KR018_006867 [Drosophila ironensis]|nr:hypothetical protein KR018_006867 [Drosophila ironensis]
MPRTVSRDLLLLCVILSLPIRIVLLVVYLYTQNLSALLHMIQDILLLLLRLTMKIRKLALARIINGPGEYPILPESVVVPWMLFLRRQMHNVGMTLHIVSDALRIPGAMLMRLSRLFRICANQRTWLMMLRHTEGR